MRTAGVLVIRDGPPTTPSDKEADDVTPSSPAQTAHTDANKDATAVEPCPVSVTLSPRIAQFGPARAKAKVLVAQGLETSRLGRAMLQSLVFASSLLPLGQSDKGRDGRQGQGSRLPVSRRWADETRPSGKMLGDQTFETVSRLPKLCQVFGPGTAPLSDRQGFCGGRREES